MRAIAEGALILNYAFADIAAAFRLIEETMVLVIILVSIDVVAGAECHLFRDLKHTTSVGGIARQLQRQLLLIPRRAREARSAGPTAPDKLGDQFIVLSNKDLYAADAGLNWDDPTFRTPLIM